MEHTHREDRAFVILTDRTEAAPVTPPQVPFVPASESPYAALFAHYERYRRHPAYYMQPASDAPICWYEAEQAKATAST